MEKRRYHLLDELRGLAVLCMVVFHGFFSVYMVFGSGWAYDCIDFFFPAEPYFAALFFLISGISSRLASSNLKNGLRLGAVALAVSAVTIIATHFTQSNMSIYFGVLHCLAVCLLLAAALRSFRPRFALLWCVLSLLLFLWAYEFIFGFSFLPSAEPRWVGSAMPDGFEGVWWLLPFGFPEPSTPAMADYFPIFPWVFMFLAGRFIPFGERIKNFALKPRLRPLGFVGRRALIIYVLHQPIIFGLCFLVKTFMGGLA